ncbi:carbohydrate kinase family protein [Amycolatopsis alkalitolerans]|uniref:Carbohydrate kinase family protein n=1 Tax=Amycolatopsis alkalitolerans TaxID=2547244 RepID=A0A5C4M165_9PSEU|nr:carbohydrate kinase family protein [Amycolatopsis alkalitolerans]TNC26392.1 carbohydrate kinase family protein [Amycolatopsis alkalitolerans]
MTRRILVTGSIATDHLMDFPGRFTDHLLADQLHTLSLSVLVDGLTVRRGGVAANIAIGLASLGLPPVLVGAVGTDFDDYRTWLHEHRVDIKSVHVSTTQHTARFVCTTDRDHNQIASFYAGAMTEARDISLAAVAERVGVPELVVIGPNDPKAMLRYTDDCRRYNYAFAADISQQLSTVTGAEVRELVEGARYLFTNAYEAALLLRTARWQHHEVLARVGFWITTHGASGVTIEQAGHPTITVPAVSAKQALDPTGVGDAFRAGFLWGRVHRLSLARAAQAGCTLATIVLETTGAQNYRLDRTAFSDRVARTYGGIAAADIESKLRI